MDDEFWLKPGDVIYSTAVSRETPSGSIFIVVDVSDKTDEFGGLTEQMSVRVVNSKGVISEWSVSKDKKKSFWRRIDDFMRYAKSFNSFVSSSREPTRKQ